MKPFTTGAIAGAAAGLAGAVALATRRKKTHGPSRLLHCDAAELSFESIMPGVQRAIVWGDPDRGAYAAFTRFDAGVSHPLHTHPNDITILVVSGAYVYRAGDREIRVGPGSYLFVPAGTPHTSAADPNEPSLFFEESTSRFGLIPTPQA